MHGVDIARALTDEELDLLVERGFGFVMRYIVGGAPKELYPDEAARVLGRRLGLVPIYQTTANYVGYFTYDRGLADGRDGAARCLAKGVPVRIPLYFPYDLDVPYPPPQWAIDYANGIYDGLARRYLFGIYSEYDIVRFARERWPAVARFWQTRAWSAERVYDIADLFQHANGVELRPGFVVDLDIARSPIPWRVAA